MRSRDVLQMKCFVEVADLLSFSKAARQLGVTPSAVSQSVRQLEKRIGARLFIRTTRDVSMTSAGQRLLEDVRPALTALERAHATLLGLGSEPPGPLRVNLPQVAAEQLVAPRLPDFSRRYPLIDIELSIDNALIDLSALRFDAGIRRGEFVKEDMIAKRISADDHLVAVASPAYLEARGDPASPDELKTHATIRIRHRSTGLVSPWRFFRGEACVAAKPSGPLIVDDPGLARSMAIAGMGIARLARTYVQSAIDRDELRPVLGDWQATLSGFFLYYRREPTPSPALHAFRDFMRHSGDTSGSAPLAFEGRQ